MLAVNLLGMLGQVHIMRLLLVEDNLALTRRLERYLSKQFDVQVAHTGSEGQQMAQTDAFDIVVLDLSLPDIYGQEVCAVLRQNSITTPILILSAEGSVASKVRLLEEGADDYLPKPFEAPELMARIKALIRRRQAGPIVSVLKAGDLVIDPRKRTVERAGIPIELRRKEFEILEYLMRNRGIVITQAMLLDRIWNPDKEVWSNTLRVHMKHLRDKIDRPFATPLIRTARGIGYVLDSA